jgi:hypoxanthine-DNA glycosylase
MIPNYEFKTSFSAIADSNIEILILGSMPSDTSLLQQEYYAHPQNRFWKILAAITNNTLPQEYSEKIQLLKNNSIALWDVVHHAKRRGSMDSAIVEESPNDIETFLLHHLNCKTIAFNGKKSEALFDKYFVRKSHIHYISLPSSSPANAGITFEALCERWKMLLSNK